MKTFTLLFAILLFYLFLNINGEEKMKVQVSVGGDSEMNLIGENHNATITDEELDKEFESIQEEDEEDKQVKKEKPKKIKSEKEIKEEEILKNAIAELEQTNKKTQSIVNKIKKNPNVQTKKPNQPKQNTKKIPSTKKKNHDEMQKLLDEEMKKMEKTSKKNDTKKPKKKEIEKKTKPVQIKPKKVKIIEKKPKKKVMIEKKVKSIEKKPMKVEKKIQKKDSRQLSIDETIQQFQKKESEQKTTIPPHENIDLMADENLNEMSKEDLIKKYKSLKMNSIMMKAKLDVQQNLLQKQSIDTSVSGADHFPSNYQDGRKFNTNTKEAIPHDGEIQRGEKLLPEESSKLEDLFNDDKDEFDQDEDEA